MASLVESYVGQLFKTFKRFAPWTPDVPMQIGAVGVIEGGEFRRKTTLSSLGIPWKAAPPGPLTVLDYTSSKGVTVTMKAKGQALAGSPLAAAEAGASLSFQSSGGIVLQASGVRVHTIEDVDVVGRGILELYEIRIWEPEWVFIDEVQTAESTTIVVSEASNTRLDLRAAGDLATKVPLAGDFSMAFKKGSITSFVGEAGFTPLFHLSRVEARWFETFVTGKHKGKISGAKGARAVRTRTLPTAGKTVLESVSPAITPRTPSKKSPKGVRRK